MGKSVKSEDPTGRAHNRREQLLAAAARLFGTKGFNGTSIRDIAEQVGMLPGSVYYHFSSKEELFAAVHAAGIERVLNAVSQAVSKLEDPWSRLEAAAVTHLAELLDSHEIATVVMPGAPYDHDTVREKLIAQRDRYESFLQSLINATPLPPGTDRELFRLALLGALNSVSQWYRPGGRMLPADIARSIFGLFRCSAPPRRNRVSGIGFCPIFA